MKKIIFILSIIILTGFSKISFGQTPIIEDRTGMWNGYPWIIIPDGTTRAFNVDSRDGRRGRLVFFHNEGPGVYQGAQFDSRGWFVFGNGDPSAPFHVNEAALFSTDATFRGKVDVTNNINVTGNATIKGTVVADRISLSIGSFPDYVFESNYKLRSIYDLEKFIQNNKHLPGIPAAKVIEKEGMNVGEMNRILVEKVEELTLYTVNQQRLIDQLKIEVDQLKANSNQ
ncbi:MAG: hypothetical protein ACEPOW_10210 [Bacteroidales bacterium]